MQTTARIDRNWDERYRTGDTPWDSRLPSAELRQTLAEFAIPRGTAIELGCGTGTNAIWLAEQGFQVVAVDCSTTAIDTARQAAATAGVAIDWLVADVQRLELPQSPCDFIFDRGCYHCCRRVDLEGYLQTHRNVTRPGAWALVLTGNANDPGPGGPPRVTASELAREFEPLYRIHRLREFWFEDAGGIRGPRGWACLMQRL
jgi:SAM-dependent methyltransferase